MALKYLHGEHDGNHLWHPFDGLEQLQRVAERLVPAAHPDTVWDVTTTTQSPRPDDDAG